jgi:hypothetical protein
MGGQTPQGMGETAPSGIEAINKKVDWYERQN